MTLAEMKQGEDEMEYPFLQGSVVSQNLARFESDMGFSSQGALALRPSGNTMVQLTTRNTPKRFGLREYADAYRLSMTPFHRSDDVPGRQVISLDSPFWEYGVDKSWSNRVLEAVWESEVSPSWDVAHVRFRVRPKNHKKSILLAHSYRKVEPPRFSADDLELDTSSVVSPPPQVIRHLRLGASRNKPDSPKPERR